MSKAFVRELFRQLRKTVVRTSSKITHVTESKTTNSMYVKISGCGKRFRVRISDHPQRSEGNWDVSIHTLDGLRDLESRMIASKDFKIKELGACNYVAKRYCHKRSAKRVR